jgi:hypothetical protein
MTLKKFTGTLYLSFLIYKIRVRMSSTQSYCRSGKKKHFGIVKRYLNVSYYYYIFWYYVEREKKKAAGRSPGPYSLLTYRF